MTRDDVLRWAREAGFEDWALYGRIESKESALNRFAVLVAAAEREACARLCETPIDEIQVTDDISELRYMDAHECATAIRARGQE